MCRFCRFCPFALVDEMSPKLALSKIHLVAPGAALWAMSPTSCCACILDHFSAHPMNDRVQVVDSVDLNGLIRLFVNHRPVFPISKQVG